MSYVWEVLLFIKSKHLINYCGCGNDHANNEMGAAAAAHDEEERGGGSQWASPPSTHLQSLPLSVGWA